MAGSLTSRTLFNVYGVCVCVCEHTLSLSFSFSLSLSLSLSKFSFFLRCFVRSSQFIHFFLYFQHAVPNMIAFLRTLRQLIHARSPHGLVLWYDSITRDGSLSWQNELNTRNRFEYGWYLWRPQIG